jgi:glutathionylspermidine synthase
LAWISIPSTVSPIGAACYAFTTIEIDVIEAATADLHALCLRLNDWSAAAISNV